MFFSAEKEKNIFINIRCHIFDIKDFKQLYQSKKKYFKYTGNVSIDYSEYGTTLTLKNNLLKINIAKYVSTDNPTPTFIFTPRSKVRHNYWMNRNEISVRLFRNTGDFSRTIKLKYPNKKLRDSVYEELKLSFSEILRMWNNTCQLELDL